MHRIINIIVLVSIISGVQSDGAFQCHDLFEYDASTKGEIASPFYGERSYPEELWCEYRITAPEEHRIKLTFKDFDLEPSGLCTYDQLVVFSKDKDEELWKFCGRNPPNPVISKEGENEIRLLFRTDFMVGGRGFRIEYESGPELELCSDNERECRNRNCYEAGKKCDDVDDCGDGTDEERCENRVVQPPKSCGTPSFQPITSNEFPDRQVGGIEVAPHSWPWQVSLQETKCEPNGHICGGTLINPQWVLTAAHCASRTMTPMDMKVVIGSHNKFEKSKYQVVRMAEKIISYPDLEFQKLVQYNIKHDIALIKLNAPVTFNDGIQAACLPKPGWELEIGSICMAIGWGETRGSGFSDMLKQSEVIMQDKYHCGYDAKSQICVARNYSAPCHGDSGGPLLCKYSGKWYVLGATSMGLFTNDLNGLCALPGSKVLFSKAADKIEWIQQVVDKYS